MAKLEFNNIRDRAKEMAKDITETGKDLSQKGVVKAKEGARIISEQVAEAKYEFDKKTINPIKLEEINNPEYTMPSLLQLIEYDKKMANPVCKDALGFQEKIKDKPILCLLNKYADDLEIEFYPYKTETIYYKNPYIENMYLQLDSYFKYIEDAKVHELEQIAQCLGAKKVKISFKEVKKSLVSNTAKKQGKIKIPFNKHSSTAVSANQNSIEKEFSDIKIASEIEFDGGKLPSEPELVYFKGDRDITTLVKMRLEPENTIKSKVYEFLCGTGKEMQQKEAASIDFILEKKGLTGNVSIVSEVQAEQRKILEYKIEF